MAGNDLPGIVWCLAPDTGKPEGTVGSFAIKLTHDVSLRRDDRGIAIFYQFLIRKYDFIDLYYARLMRRQIIGFCHDLAQVIGENKIRRE